MGLIALVRGTLLIHGEHDKITATQADLVVEDDRILEVGSCLTFPPGCRIIDCTDKIISPGLISTHNHLWEVPLKGICEELKAVPYFATMFTAGLTFAPEDVFWGSLAGALEAVDAGTTTVLDFAHGNWSKDHGRQAIAGTLTSGVRAVHAFSPAVTITQTQPDVLVGDLLPAWFLPTLESLAQSSPLDSKQSRVSLGLGFDYFFLDKATVTAVFEKARSLGITTFTSHSARFPGDTSGGLPAMLKAYGLLGKGYIISHMTGATKDDIEALSSAGVYISASPTMELSMGMGTPVCFRHDVPGANKVCSLGVDCMYSSVVNEMRVGLQAARANDISSSETRTCDEAFNLGTINGARALHMEQEIGIIAVGKKADLVVWDALSPAMTAAAERDPVKAIVMHSSVADVDMVIVDGVIRKEAGKLIRVKQFEWCEDDRAFVEGEGTIAWRDVAKSVLEIQEKFVAKLPGVSFANLQAFVKDLYGM